MKSIILIFVSLLLGGQTSFGQTSNAKKPFFAGSYKSVNLDVDYIYNKTNMLEFGIDLTMQPNAKRSLDYCLFLSTEYAIAKTRNVFGPKIGIGVDNVNKSIGYGGKINLICYDPSKTNDFRISPEIGLTWYGFISLHYGYNLSLTKNRVPEIGNHSISLNVCIGLRALNNIFRINEIRTH